VTRLQDQLDAAAGPGAALVLVRVMHLETLNERLGRDDTDRVLRTVGDVLQTYVERVPGALAGRLNGSDFGLCLPVHGLAAETAVAIHGALVGAPALRAGGCEVAVGAADGLAGIAAGAALAEADAALAHAESVHGLAVEGRAGLAADVSGARAWRDQIAAALAEGRARLGEYPVLAPEGGLIHLECPLRLQLEDGGEFRPAAHWLSLARRSRLMPEVDLAALALALQATAADGRPRAVHIATASLGAPGFVGEVAQRLRARPDAARRLALEWVEPVRPVDVRAWAEAAALWRGEGVRLGVEHAGAAPQQLPRLQDVGIDYVKVDARHLRGLGADASVHSYAQGLLALIHGLGLVALAEGVDDASDLAALWALGFDGATGAAIGAPA
jgi:EAL domain-containing protein (putative c-di-GMP-specific phosphodiesterase class I)/GGDEF domain-containing protein